MVQAIIAGLLFYNLHQLILNTDQFREKVLKIAIVVLRTRCRQLVDGGGVPLIHLQAVIEANHAEAFVRD